MGGAWARGFCFWVLRRRTFFTTCLVLAFLLTGLHVLYKDEDLASFSIDGLEQSAGKATLDETQTGNGKSLLVPASDDRNHVSHRHELIRERCQASHLTPQGSKPWLPEFPWSPIISTKHVPNIFFCPLAKAGSTFFTRYMVAMDRPGVMMSPFDIKIADAKRSSLESFDSLIPSEKKLFLQHSFKFIFSRNPYSRIFSAFIDKLYSPNPYYWNEWGVKAATQAKLPQSKLTHCGDGISFPDFVKIIIAVLHKKDLHFLPMVDTCKVCQVEWDTVGWVEESAKDIDHLSRRIGIDSSFQHLDGYKMASAIDVIQDSTTDSIGNWKGDIQKCMSLYSMGKIIWRRLQIRGIIYNDIAFPFTEEEMDSVTTEQFQLKCKEAAAKSIDKSKLKKQKEHAFREAFSLVDRRDLKRLQDIYKNDFHIFGYDLQPSSIFGNGEQFTEENILDWSKDWV